MRLLYQVPISNNTANFYFPKGNWSNIMLVYDVTTDTGETGTRADMGSVRMNWNGDDIINTDVEMLNLLNNVYGGTSKATFATAGSNIMTAIIPAGVWTDPTNIFYIEDQDDVYIDLDFSTIAAKCTAGSVKVYSKPKLGSMSYIHKFISRFINAGSSGDVADTFAISNISQAYYKNPASDNVTHIQLLKNNTTMVDSSVTDLNYYSDYIHKLETTDTTICVDFGESGDLTENLGTQLSYKFTFSASGTIKQYFSYIQYTKDKASRSLIASQEQVRRNIGKNFNQ